MMSCMGGRADVFAALIAAYAAYLVFLFGWGL
jgi:hypothetical protein